MSDTTAVIEFFGRDKGLSAVINSSIKGINNLTGAAVSGAGAMGEYATQTLSVQDALAATVGSAKGATKALFDVTSTTTGAFQSVVTNSERTIKVADVLDNTFTKLALRVGGFADETRTANSVLQPTAGFFSDVAVEATGLGKAFTVINAAEKPVVSTLKAASGAASGLAEVLSGLGSVGQFASQGLLALAGSASNLAGIVSNVDTIGDLYQTLEQIKEVAPEAAETIGTVGTFAAGTTSSILGVTSTAQEIRIAAEGVEKFGSGFLKASATIYKQVFDLSQQLGFVASILNTIANTAIAATLHAKDFGKALDTVRNLGFDTFATETVTSLGMIGENLLFNTQASKEFANAAVSAFAKVEDALSFVTTLPAGMKAGIPELSKQLGDLVNGPLKNAISKGEAAAAMYQSLSAGIGAAAGKLKESGPFLEAALKLASGTETAAATTVETLAKVTYAYNLNVKDATKTAAKLNGVVEEGILTMPQLAGNIGRVAGVAAQAKVPLNEMLGSIAALTKTMSADDAMTGYIGLLNSIAGAGEQSKKAASELGVQFDIQAIKAKGLINVLRELYTKSGGNITKIKEIIPDSLAFGTALSLMTTAFKEAKEKTDIIGKKTGDDLENLFGARQQSFIKQTTALVNGFQEVMADFGERFTENFKPGMEFLRETLERFKDLPEPIKVSIGAIVSFNAGIEKAKGFISILIGGLTQLALTFAFIRGAAILFDGTLRKQVLVSIGAVIKAFKTGAGQTQALTALFQALTGATTIQAAASSGAAKAQGVLSTVNRILLSDTGKLVAATKAQVASISLSSIQSALAAKAKTILALATKGLSVALNITTASVAALWAAFGPLAIILGTLAVAFQLLNELVAFEVLGFKSAKAEAQDYAAKLTQLSDANAELTASLKEENSQLEKNAASYAKRIEDLKKMQQASDDPKAREIIQQQINDLNKLRQAAEKTEEKKYTGFVNNFVIPLTAGLVKFGVKAALLSNPLVGATFAISGLIEKVTGKKGLVYALGEGEKKIDEFAKAAKEVWQANLDEWNGINAAMEESQRQTDALFQKSINAAQRLNQGSPITKEAQDIIANAKARNFNAEELEKISQKETKAYENQKAVIDGKVSALQESLKIEKDPKNRQVIAQQINDLNKASSAYEKGVNAIKEYINASNDLRIAILGNESPTKKLDELGKEQEKVSQDLVNQINNAKTEQEKALRENQKAQADANLKVIEQLNQGMDSTSNLQKKQLNSLIASYKEFADNASRTEIGVNFQDLNVMRTEADKLLEEVEKNLDNISGKTAESMVEALLNQQIRLKDADIAGSILSAEQLEAALDTLRKAYEKSAQDQIEINNRKITEINHQEALGIKRQNQAQKEALDYEIKNDEERLKAKQKYLDYAVKSGNISKESLLYKRLFDEIIQLQNKLEQDRTKSTSLGIDDRQELLDRDLNKAQALTEKALAERLTTEADAESKLFKLRQTANLEQRKLLIERINDLKARGGDFTQYEIELLKLQTEYEKNITENSRRNAERRKQQLANNTTEANQVHQKELTSLDIISQGMERQQKILESQNRLKQAELELGEKQVELELRRTGDIQKVADLELKLAVKRFDNLEKTQGFERQQIISQQKLQKIAIDREIINNKIAKSENERAIASLKIDIIQAKKENRSAEELKNLQLQLEALKDKTRLLDDTSQGLDESKRNQEQVAQATEKELLIRQDIVRQGGLLDLQQAKTKQIVAGYEKQAQAAQMIAQQLETAGLAENSRLDALDKVYEKQTQLIEAQKTAVNGKVNKLTTELQIVQELTRSEVKKRDLAQTIAQIKYRSLMEQQKLERNVLELQILQNRAAEKRNELALKQQAAQNKADVITAYAEREKVLRDPKASDADKLAANLNLQAKLEQGAVLAFSMSQSAENRKIQNYLENAQRQNLADQQESATSQAKMDIINTLSPTNRAIAARQFRRELLQKNVGFGVGETDNDLFNRVRQGNRIGLAEIFGNSKFRDQALMNRPTPGFIPNINTPQTPGVAMPADYDTIRKNFLAQMQEFLVPSGLKVEVPQIQNPSLSQQQPPNKPGEKGNRKLDESTKIENVTLQIEAINIDVASDKATPQDAAKEVKDAILNELYQLGTKVKTRLK